MNKDLYAVLGVSRMDSKESIRKAYKRLATQHHPDKPSGDHDAFIEIQNAHDILTDDNRRAQYDLTGDTRPEIQIDDVRRQQLAMLMLQIIAKQEVNTATFNIVQLMRNSIIDETLKANELIEGHQNGIIKLYESVTRMKMKSGAKGFLTEVLERQIQNNEAHIEKFHAKIENFEALLVMLDEYEYDTHNQTWRAA